MLYHIKLNASTGLTTHQISQLEISQWNISLWDVTLWDHHNHHQIASHIILQIITRLIFFIHNTSGTVVLIFRKLSFLILDMQHVSANFNPVICEREADTHHFRNCWCTADSTYLICVCNQKLELQNFIILSLLYRNIIRMKRSILSSVTTSTDY